MNTFDFVKRFTLNNNIKQIVVGSEEWGKLVSYIGTFYPDLDSEYYGNELFEELFDLNITIVHPD
jgi:hypothetical protein